MSRIVSLLGSPSASSRSAALLAHLERRLAEALDDAQPIHRIALRELPAAALLAGEATAGPIAEAVAAVREARLVLVATPIYKAAYSGLLKTFLDLLPQDALHGTTVVPLATGGSPGHLLALDYALRPVLAALGAHDIRAPIFASDAQLPSGGRTYLPVQELEQRLERTVADLLGPTLGWSKPATLRRLDAVRTSESLSEARCTA